VSDNLNFDFGSASKNSYMERKSTKKKKNDYKKMKVFLITKKEKGKVR
jgi:hypothetical protein